jgi:hypothetical protein
MRKGESAQEPAVSAARKEDGRRSYAGALVVTN